MTSGGFTVHPGSWEHAPDLICDSPADVPAGEEVTPAGPADLTPADAQMIREVFADLFPPTVEEEW